MTYPTKWAPVPLPASDRDGDSTVQLESVRQRIYAPGHLSWRAQRLFRGDSWRHGGLFPDLETTFDQNRIDRSVRILHVHSMHLAVGELFKSPVFWSAFFGWMVASVLKMLPSLRESRRIDFHYLTALGGMPSAHSAMVSGLATAVGLREGFGSTLFSVSLAFALVVMFDASTVRRATGLQARLLNQIVDEVFKHHHLSAQKLKEILGHTRMEVFAGLLVGIVTGVTISYIAR